MGILLRCDSPCGRFPRLKIGKPGRSMGQTAQDRSRSRARNRGGRHGRTHANPDRTHRLRLCRVHLPCAADPRDAGLRPDGDRIEPSGGRRPSDGAGGPCGQRPPRGRHRPGCRPRLHRDPQRQSRDARRGRLAGGQACGGRQALHGHARGGAAGGGGGRARGAAPFGVPEPALGQRLPDGAGGPGLGAPRHACSV